MLQKEFFQVQPFNPNPYWNPVIVNLSGAQKFEENTVFVPGRYKIEVAPGRGTSYLNNSNGGVFFPDELIVNMTYIEDITQSFIIRAYCGSDGTKTAIGTNPYSGSFKVNGQTASVSQAGIDVNHIFGAGGGNMLHRDLYLFNTYGVGGGNCLGNGTIEPFFSNSFSDPNAIYHGGAGSCLHLLPIGGTFGTDYIRAYHAAPKASLPGGAYGGGAGANMAPTLSGDFWFRGGNSPYGNGGVPASSDNPIPGTGVGAGGQLRPYVDPLTQETVLGTTSGGAYFNGTTWIDRPGEFDNNSFSSRIRITYLGPLN